MKIVEDLFGEHLGLETNVKGQVKRYTLSGDNGVKVKVISYGASISDIVTPDRDGILDHITLGFDKFQEYPKFDYIGSTIGRHANRIHEGKFELDGRSNQLIVNNNNNHLHGGTKGWDKVMWSSCIKGDSVIFSHVSHDGDQGYPGTVLAHVIYTLGDHGSLTIQYQAMTTDATPINLTNHSFFNLAGHAAGQKGLLEHEIYVNADRYLSITPQLIPTGDKTDVSGTAFDLRVPTLLSTALSTAPDGGFDHCFCLYNKQRNVLELASRIVHPPSGRTLEVYTTEPGLQIYTGNFLPKEVGVMVGRANTSYTYQGALCCEPQNFPDAINNKDEFPCGVLRPGNMYQHTIVFTFHLQE